ncbi:geranylgeranylglyceryl/heptaprenylglyceryl phosphate synthase [bacterium]|nr:geranylgeranylglyceryl/heptaprenylglyceryl phosphate synthase [bacterium]
MPKVYFSMRRAREDGRTLLAVLLDPDRFSEDRLDALLAQPGIDLFFVGGSLISGEGPESVLRRIRALSSIPTVLFPGSVLQVHPEADALLFLSLISGRNPELLIGQHVLAAPLVKRSQLEVIPTGYLLVDGGRPTTASYISGCLPLPHNKPEIAATTAMAGEMLGLRALYLDAGSGADRAVHPAMIEAVRSATEAPLIVGGGIRTSEQAFDAARAGATVVVVGNVLEQDPHLVSSFAQALAPRQRVP